MCGATDKEGVTNSKGCCHIALCTSWLQILVENGHRTKRGDFKGYPTWGQRVAVLDVDKLEEEILKAI